MFQNEDHVLTPMLMLTPLLLFASVAALSDSEIPADTVTLPDVVAAAPAKTNVTLLPLNTNIVTEEVIDLSFASNDFLRQRHKKTTWILA